MAVASRQDGAEKLPAVQQPQDHHHLLVMVFSFGIIANFN
jgi:hypothetical protein